MVETKTVIFWLLSLPLCSFCACLRHPSAEVDLARVIYSSVLALDAPNCLGALPRRVLSPSHYGGYPT